MKKQYSEPELEIMRFSFADIMQNPVTPHSTTEYGGATGGNNGDGDEIDNDDYL